MEWGVFLFLFGSLLARSFERLRVAHLWAEDGALFLNQAYSIRWASLWHSYAGYFHGFPRLVSLVSTALPLVVVPTFIYLMAAAACAAACGKFASDEFDHIVPDRLVRAAICLGLTFAAGFFEDFGNLGNSHWFFAFYAALLGMRRLDARLSRFEILGFILAITTAGETTILLPIYAYRAWRSWLREDALCVLALGTFFLVNLSIRDVALLNNGITPARALSAMTYVWTNHFILIPFFGEKLVSYLGRYRDWLYWTLSLGGSFWYGRTLWRLRRDEGGRQLLVFLFSYLAIILTMFVARDYVMGFLANMVVKVEAAKTRWAIVPSFAAYFAMACTLYKSGGSLRQARWRSLAFTSLWIMLAAPTRFAIGTYQDVHGPGRDIPLWSTMVRDLRPADCRRVVTVSIMPDPWTVEIPGEEFPACSKNSR